MKKLFILLMLICVTAAAQEEAPDNGAAPGNAGVITLPEIEVLEKRPVKDTTQVITQEALENKGVTNLWEAMGTIPGVVLTGGGERNESNFRLRGFDAARVPVFIDGVSQAIPYRGEADHGRILTYDLESIEVQKGYSSMLMGANNIGGIIYLTSAKPKKPFEASIRYGADFDGMFNHQRNTVIASLGTRQDLFYAKASYAYADQSHFRLPDDFRPRSDYQPDWMRRDSYENDSKVTAILGLTPLTELDIWATYTRQRAGKASPGDVTVIKPKIWDWTRWDRDSISLNAAYEADRFYVKALAYYDKFDNRLYNTRPHGIPADYDDFAAAVRLTGGYDINSWNNIQISGMFRQESHNGHDNVTGIYTKDLKITEFTYSIGAEYSTNPIEPLTIALGFG